MAPDIRLHTAAAEKLAAEGRWEDAYTHLRAAMRLLHGQPEELDRLRREHAEARELSHRDSLTATFNRRYLDERLTALLANPADPAVAVNGISVALVDVDHFKLVNDAHGHLFGDRVLRQVVAELAVGLPGPAFCARYGGEEFALVLPGLDLEPAVRICEAARDRVARHPWHEIDAALRITVSVGAAHCDGRPADVEGLLGEADALLYAAKRSGRNAVAYRRDGIGRVALAGPAAHRRAIPQPAPGEAARRAETATP